MPELNAPAPDFTLKNHLHEEVTLSGLRGKTVVLAFYPAAFTGICEKELCTFRDAMDSLNDANASVYGLSVDSPFANAVFAANNQFTFQLLSDCGGVAIKAYDAEFPDFAGIPGYTVAKRAVYVVDSEGILRYRWVAPNPGVEPDYEEVKSFVREL